MVQQYPNKDTEVTIAEQGQLQIGQDIIASITDGTHTVTFETPVGKIWKVKAAFGGKQAGGQTVTRVVVNYYDGTNTISVSDVSAIKSMVNLAEWELVLSAGQQILILLTVTGASAGDTVIGRLVYSEASV